MRDVNVAVHHHTHADILACFALTVFTKFRDGAQRCGFRRLPTRIGITLRIQHQDVDVLGEAQDVIQPAKADVVSPAVAANQPDGFFDQRVSVGQQLLCTRDPLKGVTQRCHLLATHVGCRFGVKRGIQFGRNLPGELLQQAHDSRAVLINGEAEAQAKLGVILK